MNPPIRRALVSVFHKDGIVELCQTLHDKGVEILSSGGTARLLTEAGIPVTRVADYTGFPEMLDGRVKTLHPRIHGGILAIRGNAQHQADMDGQGILPIDLVVVNLYPFEQTVATPGKSRADIIEMIDIGGPTMVRAAAKNASFVGVVVNPADYQPVGDEIAEHGALSDETRRRLAIAAFEHTSRYDAAVYSYLAAPESTESSDDDPFAERLQVDFEKVQSLRYGENPHQRAAFYRDPRATGPSVATATQLQGKELSFNNILDLDAALNIVADLNQTACAIIKHGNPCGAALGSSPLEAFERALSCDPLSAFGGVIAFNRPVDGATADVVAKTFFEGVLAPSFEDAARDRLAKKKKLRLLELGALDRFNRSGFDLRRVQGGILAQDWDDQIEQVRDGQIVTERQPTEDEWGGLQLAWTLCKHIKSNAIVYTDNVKTLGVGAGQMSRVDSSKIAIEKAQHPLAGALMASDAFFPFRDGIDTAAEAGIRAVVQPGGSIRDDEVIAAANEHGMTMVFTGHRHFRH